MKIDLTTHQKTTFHEDGFLIVEKLIDPKTLPRLHQAFDDLFNGVFETGVRPDEVNWQQGKSDPSLSRQLCNGWKANRDLARVVLNENIAKTIASLAGWTGVRIVDAAKRTDATPDIHYVEVSAGGGSFHHGCTWHGSGPNPSSNPRRSLVLHAMPSEVEYVPENFNQGIGPIYSRYKRLGDNRLDENYLPILWREDGYRTPQITMYLRNTNSEE